MLRLNYVGAACIVAVHNAIPGENVPSVFAGKVNADYRKVSGMLRMIIDCTEQQANQIDSVLSTMHAKGRLQFGTHRADSAIMTCVTPNVDNHEHVHFIDGGDGGLYAAARELKAQMKRDAQ